MSDPQTAPVGEVEDGGRDAQGPSLDATRYDFRRHDRIPKDHIRSLQFLYDRFARNLRTSLSAYLRVATDVGLESVEQMAYADFLTGRPEYTAFYAVGLQPVSGLAGLEVSPTAAYAMIDRMLGGQGESTTVDRALTDIEQRVVDNVVNLILEQMTEDWQGVGKVRFTIQRRETRAEMLQIAAPNDAVVTLSLSVKLGECDGALNFCLPAALLEELGSGFVDRWRSRGHEEPVDVDRRPLYENLGRVELPTDVVLETPLKTSDLLQLSEGDVLSLGVPVHAPVDVRVCGRRKFKGTLTQVENDVSVAVHAVTVPVKA
jgi:flagellar motor switch protein FliM